MTSRSSTLIPNDGPVRPISEGTVSATVRTADDIALPVPERQDEASGPAAGVTKQTWVAPAFDGMLPELKAIPNWVLAKAVVRDGKITKPPYQPNGRPASHSDPATWSTFDAIEAAYKRGGYIGVGFVLDGQPHFGGRYLHGFDWDNCLAGDVLDPTVAAALNGMRLPRIEVSVSGCGIRAFFLHDVPLASRRTKINGRSVELYSALRYMTTTGRGKGRLK